VIQAAEPEQESKENIDDDEPKENNMTVLSKNSNGRTLTVAVNKSTTVKEMKVKFIKKMFVREFLRYMIVVERLLRSFRFVFSGKELEDDTFTLGDCGIENESNIQITQRLRGGGKRDTTDTQSSAAKRAKIECKKKSAADKDKDAKKEDLSQRAMDQIKGWMAAAKAARAETIAQQQKSKKKIAELQKKIKDKDQKIKVKNKVIAEMDQRIKRMELEIAEKDDEIADLQQQAKPSASQEYESLLNSHAQELLDFQEGKDEGEDEDEDAEKVEYETGDRVTVHGSEFQAKTKQERNTNYFATINKKEGDTYTLEFKYKDGKEDEICKLDLTDDLKMRKMSELELQAEKCAFDETPCTKCLQHGNKGLMKQGKQYKIPFKPHGQLWGKVVRVCQEVVPTHATCCCPCLQATLDLTGKNCQTVLSARSGDASIASRGFMTRTTPIARTTTNGVCWLCRRMRCRN
jgi:hypothetical protein